MELKETIRLKCTGGVILTQKYIIRNKKLNTIFTVADVGFKLSEVQYRLNKRRFNSNKK